jgi:hypothetical protein
MRVASIRILTLVAVLAACACARADIVELKNGGKIHGEIANASGRTAASYDITTDGGGRMSIPRSEVVRVIGQSPQQEEYHRRALAAPDTIEARWELAEWCRKYKLVDEYRAELTKILEIDPNHEQARLGLGHQKHSGQWKSRDDVMADRGLVMYDGKYHTQQQIELLEQAKAAKQTDADWSNKLDRWRRWLTGRRKDRSDEALREIRGLKNPEAAPAVVELMEEEQDPAVKRLLMDVAAEMDTPLVLDRLVHISLYDPNEDLRDAALDHLVATGRPGLAGPYIQALRSNDNVIVNRAADAIGIIGSRDAIGPLIGALVTKHKFKEGSGPRDQHTYVFTPSGGTAMNMGSSGAKIVTREVENAAVLAALSKLAGVNFGFDQAAWRDWLSSDAKAHPVDLRRDL